MPETPWFEVDKNGLKQILARKGKEFILYELIQNAWDENTTEVHVTLERIRSTRYVSLTVEDDNPEGFADLSHAFTLFAESKKKGEPEKRGRFNLGEKLVLALCEEAEIHSTKGTVRFTPEGRSFSRAKTERGSRFTGRIRMTDEEIETATTAIHSLIVPLSVNTYFNGDKLPQRTPVHTFETVLATEISDEEGQLRRTSRKTTVQVYEAEPTETATLYELGIPVVATTDRWHINVGQKVPLNIDRDNVSPAYLANLRAKVVEQMQEQLTQTDANAPWVKEAITKYGDELSNKTVERLVSLRFGEKRVSYDPSDPEANKLAVAEGYTVVHGGTLSKEEWGVIRRSSSILPAGQVTPSPKPYGPDGRELEDLPEEAWTTAIRSVVDYACVIARHLLRENIRVRVVNASWWRTGGGRVAATFGRSQPLVLNYAALGDKFFEGKLSRINDLLIHEFGHYFSLDHLSSDYHDALTKLGGELSVLALEKPELFQSVLAARSVETAVAVGVGK